MSNWDILAHSASIEQALTVCFLFVVLPIAIILSVLDRMGWIFQKSSQTEQPLSFKVECLSLLVVIIFATFLRFFWWDQNIPGTIFGSLSQMLLADDLIKSETAFGEWLAMLSKPGAFGWVYASPLLLPLDCLFRLAFGPFLFVEVLIGGFWGLATILLVWQLGRLLYGPFHGLLVACLITISPLQIVWSRLGFRVAAALPHVLLVMLLGLLAGKKKSHALAALTGICSFLTIYNHDSARIGIPMAFVAIVSGMPNLRKNWGRVLSFFFVIALSHACLFYALGYTDAKTTYWPNAGGYAGNVGETSLVEVAQKNIDRVIKQSIWTFELTFLYSREFFTPLTMQFGMQFGGHILVPVAVLGAIGFLWALWSWRNTYLWLIYFAGSWAVPALSCAQSRRLLLIDIAWCVFAAFGLQLLLKMSVLRRLSISAKSIFALILTLMLGAWTFVYIVLSSNDPSRMLTRPPFASSGCVGDIVSCTDCVTRAIEWENRIASGDLVILFDSDGYREVATAPAGYPELGHLAARSSNHDHHFLEFYKLASHKNVAFYKTGFRPVFSNDKSYIDNLQTLFEDLRYRSIVWYFEKPNAFEDFLAQKLSELGGTLTHYSKIDSIKKGIRVVIAKEKAPFVIDFLRSLTPSVSQLPKSGIGVVPAGQQSIDRFARSIVAVPKAARHFLEQNGLESVQWLPIGGDGFSFGDRKVARFGLVFAAVVPLEDGSFVIQAITRFRELLTYSLPNLELDTKSYPTRFLNLPKSHLIEAGCARTNGTDWFSIDLHTGQLYSSTQIDWLPDKDWIGVDLVGSKLVLASSDQIVYVFDLDSQSLLTQFSAQVWPVTIPGERYGECAAIAYGDELLAAVDYFGRRVLLYNHQGKLEFILSNQDSIRITDIDLVGDVLISVHSFDNKVRKYVFIEDVKIDLSTIDAGSKRTLFDFEDGDLGDWTISGDAFGPTGVREVSKRFPFQSIVSGVEGRFFINSMHGGDGTTGRLLSPEFVISKPILSFLIAGGEHPGLTSVGLWVDGDIVRSATGNNSEDLKRHYWDVSKLVGQKARLEIADQATAGWGHILVDDVALFDAN